MKWMEDMVEALTFTVDSKVPQSKKLLWGLKHSLPLREKYGIEITLAVFA